MTLYRLLRRYWQRGQTPNALLPDYARCGGTGRDKAVTEARRGRRPLIDRAVVNVTPEMRQIFRAVVAVRFATSQVMSLRESYREMIVKHYSDRVLDERSGRQILIPRAGLPSLRQFSYWFRKDNDVFDIERKRRTPRVYDKDMRALLGSSTAETSGPGSRYQIDATIGDVYLLSRYDRRKIVGRPVIYVVIDVFSHMIVGLHVGFEGPSWLGAMEAVGNATADKVAYCQRFGIEIAETDWPCHGLPQVLLGDRGEMAGSMIKTLINNFSVTVENTAPYRADWKGLVEQQFRLIPAKFKAYVPGYIQADYQERGGPDYRLDATLDIDQITRVIILCILQYNNLHRLEGYPRAADLIADDVQPIPIELWEWGIVRRTGRLRSCDPERVRLSLLPSGEATVTAQGIRYAGCFYSNPKALQEHWFERARQRGKWTVEISYDPRNMDEIHVHEKAGQPKFLPCSLTDLSRHHQGRTLWEIDELRQRERLQRAGHQPEQLQGRINLIDQIQQVIAEGVAMRPDTSDLSKRERVRNIRGNRREERLALQQRDAVRLPRAQPPDGGEVVPFPGAKVPDDYSLPDIAEYLRRFEEEASDDKL